METITYTSTHKNLLKSTVRIKRLNLFKELKSVSGGRLFHGTTTRTNSLTAFQISRVLIQSVAYTA